MSNPGKKRAAEWCAFCEVAGHTQNDCHRWAACMRISYAAALTAVEAHGPSQKPKAFPPNKKKRPRGCRGGGRKRNKGGSSSQKPTQPGAASASLFPPPPPHPAFSAEASSRASTQPITNNPTTTEGSSNVDQSDLLLRLGQVSQAEAEFLVQALQEYREITIADEQSHEQPTPGLDPESDYDIDGQDQ